MGRFLQQNSDISIIPPTLQSELGKQKLEVPQTADTDPNLQNRERKMKMHLNCRQQRNIMTSRSHNMTLSDNQMSDEEQHEQETETRTLNRGCDLYSDTRHMLGQSMLREAERSYRQY